MNTCIYCKKDFIQKYTLNRHLKKASKCNKLRNNEKIDKKEKKEETIKTCLYCDKILSTKQRLDSHLKICKKSQQIIFLKEEITRLKEIPIIITINNTDNSTNKSVINNNYSSLLDINPDSITDSFKKHYNTIVHFDQKQLANITVKHFLSGKEHPMYYITDRSRNKFMYTDEKNNEQEDTNASILRSLVYKGIKPIINKLYKEEKIKLNNNLKKSQRDDIASNIATAHDDIKELEESYKKANILKAGEDYISQLSKCLPSSIKDRIYRDSINISDVETDHDIELEKELRVIGDYTANELKGFKKLYKETGETRGPSSIIRHQKYLDQYIAFLKE